MRVDAALMPKLRAGAVFENGVEVPGLPFQERRFEFPRDRTEVRVKRATDEGVTAARPEEWEDDWRVLEQHVYGRGRSFPDVCLVVLTNKITGETLQIPAFEVFARLVAPNGLLAQTLIGGPWDRDWTKVANPDHTRGTPNKSQIVLRRGFELEDAFPVHLLRFDPEGLKAANGIYGAIQMVADGAVLSRYGNIVPFRCSLPFVLPKRLKIKVKGFTLYPDDTDKVFVGMQILKVYWPLPDLILVRDLDNRNTEGDTVEISQEGSRWPSRREARPREHDGAIETAPNDDPMRGRDPMRFAAPSDVWSNKPEARRVQWDQSTHHTGRRTPPEDPVSTEGVSFAQDETGGEATPATTKARPVYDAVERFERVAAMFRDLRDKGEITSGGVRTAPKGLRERVGTLQAWRFPETLPGKKKHHAWSRLYPSSADTRLRAALVLRVQMKDAVFVVLVTQTRPGSTESYASLVCRARIDLNRQVRLLLNLGAEVSGRWRDPDHPGWAKYGLRPGRRWFHVPKKRKGDDSLSPTSFVNAVDDLMGWEPDRPRRRPSDLNRPPGRDTKRSKE